MAPWVLIVSSAIAALADGASPVSPVDRGAYEAAKSQAGRDPESQIRLALWCEAHGLNAERLKHLAIAVLTDPRNARARGLMGLVAYGGKWEDPTRVGRRIHADEALSAKRAEYNGRRDQLKLQIEGDGRSRPASRVEAARAHAALGSWCQANGLAAEATAHFTSSVVLDPYRETAWKGLGYIKHHRRWVSPEQLAAEQKEQESRRRASRFWEPKLRKWRADLASIANREEATRKLAEVNDPSAVSAIVHVFRNGNQADQTLAVQLLGQIDAAASTRELASLAVFSPSWEVRSAATQILRTRETRDYAEALVLMIRAPMNYKVQPVGGPGSPGALLVETPRVRMLRNYDAPPAFRIEDLVNGYVGYDENGMPIVAQTGEVRLLTTSSPEARKNAEARIEARTADMVAQARLKAASSQQQLIADVAYIETANAQNAVVNTRVATLLNQAADAPRLPADDEDSWQGWWYDKLGYSYTRPPQVSVVMTAAAQADTPSLFPVTHTACFVAGTLVRTIDGRQAIETLRVGDQVLSQDTATGALSFQPILVVHRNPPSETRRITLDDGETIVASIYHRFWRAGRGWAMARELETGDQLRTLGGVARIVSIAVGEKVPVFNLDVARDRTYFVGQRDALVHDNTLPNPHASLFDAQPVVKTVAREGE